VWTRAFETSIASPKDLSAELSVLAIVGLGLRARLLADARAARLTRVTAAAVALERVILLHASSASR
jgi:hypothetical protein